MYSTTFRVNHAGDRARELPSIPLKNRTSLLLFNYLTAPVFAGFCLVAHFLSDKNCER